MSEESVVIVNGARTPMGGLMGSLSAVPATELASTAVAATIERSGIDAGSIDEVFMGCVLPAGLKQCPARQAAIGAGIPVSAGAVTVNKACGSGMQATIFAFDSIMEPVYSACFRGNSFVRTKGSNGQPANGAS